MGREPRRGLWHQVADFLALLAFLVISPILLPALLVFGLYRWTKGGVLRRKFRREYRAQGKVGVLVYSESPHWKEHIEADILPRIADRVVVLNWSLRAEWKRHKPLEVQVFEHWGGSREFNPMAIIFPARGRVKTIRLWQAFIELKHGKTNRLRNEQARLFDAIDAA
jgi:hypothetical protein